MTKDETEWWRAQGKVRRRETVGDANGNVGLIEEAGVTALRNGARPRAHRLEARRDRRVRCICVVGCSRP